MVLTNGIDGQNGCIPQDPHQVIPQHGGLNRFYSTGTFGSGIR